MEELAEEPTENHTNDTCAKGAIDKSRETDVPEFNTEHAEYTEKYTEQEAELISWECPKRPQRNRVRNGHRTCCGFQCAHQKIGS